MAGLSASGTGEGPGKSVPDGEGGAHRRAGVGTAIGGGERRRMGGRGERRGHKSAVLERNVSVEGRTSVSRARERDSPYPSEGDSLAKRRSSLSDC